MKYFLAVPILAVLACVVAGCVGDFWPSDKPLNWQYHDHPLRLYVRTVNQALDTTGTVSCTLRLNGCTYSRPGGYEGDMNYHFSFSLPETLNVEFAWPDTDWHTYRTTVHHLVGYQTEKGGDTTRLSPMAGANWSMTLNVGLVDGHGRLNTGRRLHTYCHSFDSFPDTVGSDSVIEVQMVCDMAHFAYEIFANTADTTLMLEQSAVSRHRR
jgi:hypothetical protein